MSRNFAVLPALALCFALSSGAYAATLPKTAVKQSGSEIKALFDGNTLNFTRLDNGSTGKATYDLKKGISSGTFELNKQKGTFINKVRINGDLFCVTPPKVKEYCQIIYTDGPDIYAVDARSSALLVKLNK